MTNIDVMQFIRQDGPASAPLLFLSIDGGSWDGNDTTTPREQFREYFNENGVWEPQSRCGEALEKPGIVISKIVLGLVSGSIDGWQEYRDNALYLRNECNIKYYPIGRRHVGIWREFFTSETGLTSAEYMDLCWKERPEIIFSRYESELELDPESA